jgi:hypothetical protein
MAYKAGNKENVRGQTERRIDDFLNILQQRVFANIFKTRRYQEVIGRYSCFLKKNYKISA